MEEQVLRKKDASKVIIGIVAIVISIAWIFFNPFRDFDTRATSSSGLTIEGFWSFVGFIGILYGLINILTGIYSLITQPSILINSESIIFRRWEKDVLNKKICDIKKDDWTYRNDLDSSGLIDGVINLFRKGLYFRFNDKKKVHLSGYNQKRILNLLREKGAAHNIPIAQAGTKGNSTSWLLFDNIQYYVSNKLDITTNNDAIGVRANISFTKDNEVYQLCLKTFDISGNILLDGVNSGPIDIDGKYLHVSVL